MGIGSENDSDKLGDEESFKSLKDYKSFVDSQLQVAGDLSDHDQLLLENEGFMDASGLDANVGFEDSVMTAGDIDSIPSAADPTDIPADLDLSMGGGGEDI